MFTLRVIQAKFGDCLLVIYGNKDKPKYLLIDGGPGGVYPNHLRSELEKISQTGGELELVVLSHIDGDHIVGLINLMDELKEQQADEAAPIIKVKGLWMNAFSNSIDKNNQLVPAVQSLFSKVQNINSTMPEGELAFLSIPQGNTLMRSSMILGIPVNEVVNSEVLSADTLPDPLTMDNITLTIIGPNEENLKKLEEEWKEWIQKNEAKIMMSDPEILANADKSVPNLSSIMFLMESGGKTILFTGDGRGDFILEGLQKKGLMDKEGKIHVDVFKVPHHGSIRNATAEFFDLVTADTYILSGDGHHGNPELGTMQWIVEAAKSQDRQIELICTNETSDTKKLEKEFPPYEFGYQLTYLGEGINAMDITLG